MAVQSSFYVLDGATRTYPSTKPIPTKSHMAVWLQRVSDSVWVQENVAEYELISNSCVLVQAPDVLTYSQIEVRVADTPDELGTSPADITIVAGISTEVTTVAGVADEVVVVAGDSADVAIVAGDTVAINDITTEPLRQSVLDAGDNATIAADAAVSAAASAASIDPTNLLHTVGTGAGDPEGYTTGEVDTSLALKASLTGDTFTGQVKGITPVSPEDLSRKDYIDNLIWLATPYTILLVTPSSSGACTITFGDGITSATWNSTTNSITIVFDVAQSSTDYIALGRNDNIFAALGASAIPGDKTTSSVVINNVQNALQTHTIMITKI